jgi:hypothetical protein
MRAINIAAITTAMNKPIPMNASIHPIGDLFFGGV